MWVEIVKLLETPPPTLYHYTQMCLTVERLYRCDCSFLRQKLRNIWKLKPTTSKCLSGVV